MKPDPKRAPGFYWVRFEGAPVVAEYKRFVINPVVGFWLVPGSETTWLSSEICELLSTRLDMPSPPPIAKKAKKGRKPHA